MTLFMMAGTPPLILMTSLLIFSTSTCPDNGPTQELHSVLIGRCVEYSSLVNPSAVCNLQNQLNCSAMAETFIAAFAGKETCSVQMTNFDTFLSSTRHEIPINKSLFWNDVYGFVHRYSENGRRLVTLEDTLTGYLINGLHFCSDPYEANGLGGNTTAYCPTYDQTENCTWNAEASFWTAASKEFASRARGAISIMLNASTGEAFKNTSYFGKWELPNLRRDLVTRADVLLVHTPGDAIKETCDSASIQDLRNHLEMQQIPFTCTANPLDVLWLMCWDKQSDPQCQQLVTSGFDVIGAEDLCSCT